jgi:hypothetical protein
MQPVGGPKKGPDVPGLSGRKADAPNDAALSHQHPMCDKKYSPGLQRRAFGSTTLIMKTYRCAKPSCVITSTSRLSAPVYPGAAR